MYSEIGDQEIIERYMRHQLAPDQRRALEEHFFGCEECFEKLQATERFVVGIRDTANRGLLVSSESTNATTARAWMWSALAANFAALLACAVVTVWMLFFQTPKLHERLRQASAGATAEREAIAALEKQVALSSQAETNVPLVMLQATRDAQASVNEAVLPSGAVHLVMWVEAPGGDFRSSRLQVETADHRPVVTLDHLVRNSYRALAASLPERLQPGEFRIMLTGEEPPLASLLAEYRLRIRKP